MTYTNPDKIKELMILEEISQTAKDSAHDLRTASSRHQFGARYYWIATKALHLFLKDDDLPVLEKSCQEELAEELETYIKENPEASEDACYDYISERIWQIADSNTPIYTSTIDALHYLYGHALDQAYQNAGFGDGQEDHYKQITICCYLEQTMSAFYQELREKKGAL